MSTLPPARILDVEPDAYHKLPGLSPSLAHVLVSACLLKARDKYERGLEATAEDGEEHEEAGEDEPVKPDKQARLDRGNILHALGLGVGKHVDEIPEKILASNGAASTKDAKAFIKAARDAGRIPVKGAKLDVYKQVIAAVHARLAAAGYSFDGISEFAIEWHEASPHGPVQCRTMIDHVRLLDRDQRITTAPTFAQVFELKFPGDAAPDRSERTSDSLGYHISAAARCRALNALFPSLAGRIEYRYLFCEPFRPYAFWDPTPTGAFLELGDRQWRTAVNLWAAGLSSNRWPGYHDDIMRTQIDLVRWRKLQEGFAVDE